MIPIILWTTRTISKLFRKYLNNTTGKHDIKKLQDTAMVGVAHVSCKVVGKWINNEHGDISQNIMAIINNSVKTSNHKLYHLKLSI